jgi:hypothetical protein
MENLFAVFQPGYFTDSYVLKRKAGKQSLLNRLGLDLVGFINRLVYWETFIRKNVAFSGPLP